MSKTFVIGDTHGHYKALKQVLERAKVDYEKDTVIHIGDVVDRWPESPYCVEELLKIKNLVAIRGNHDCMHRDTELLTEFGWQQISAIKPGTQLAQLEKDGTIGFALPIGSTRKYSETLIDIEGEQTHQVVTPNHDVLVKGKKVKAISLMGQKVRESDIYISAQASKNGKLSSRQVKLVCEELIKTDASVDPYGKHTLVSVDLNNLDLLQDLFVRSGIECWIGKVDSKGFPGRQQYRLTYWPNKKATRRKHLNIKEVPYGDMTYCFQMPASNLVSRYNGKIAITGNCWAEEWLHYGVAQPIWLSQGGQSTYDAYYNTGYYLDERHHKFFRDQHNYYVDDQNRAFVHAGYSDERGLGFEPSVSEYYWTRQFWATALSGRNSQEIPKKLRVYKEVYIGHTSTLFWDKKEPIQACNVWNLDTGAGGGGFQTIMDIDTKEFWQSDYVNEMY